MSKQIVSQGKEQTLDWCDECQKWHTQKALTICQFRKKLRKYLVDSLLGEQFDEPKGIAPQRPWKNK